MSAPHSLLAGAGWGGGAELGLHNRGVGLFPPPHHILFHPSLLIAIARTCNTGPPSWIFIMLGTGARGKEVLVWTWLVPPDTPASKLWDIPHHSGEGGRGGGLLSSQAPVSNVVKNQGGNPTLKLLAAVLS